MVSQQRFESIRLNSELLDGRWHVEEMHNYDGSPAHVSAWHKHEHSLPTEALRYIHSSSRTRTFTRVCIFASRSQEAGPSVSADSFSESQQRQPRVFLLE